MEKATKKTKKPLEPWQIEDAERLRALFKSRSTLSQLKFGSEFEIGNQSMVYQYLSAIRPLNIDVAKKFATGLDCKIDEFSPTLAGKIASASVRISSSDKFASQGRAEALIKNPKKTSPQLSENDTIHFELYDIQASAGPGRTIKEHPQVLRQVSVLESWARQTLGNRDFSNVKLITANGTSMQGTIENGDVLFVDISVKQFDGDGIYVISRSDELHVKRLQRLHGMRLAIISDNKSNKTETLNAQEANEVIICGRVLATWNLKRLWM